MRLSIIGQSYFGKEVCEELRKDHQIVVVYTPLDNAKTGKEDPLATAAAAHNVKVIKRNKWRSKGVYIDSQLEEFTSYNVDLNIMAFVSQFIPLEICNAPKYNSICYHPSILPRGRGASAINWTLIKGDAQAGYYLR